MSTPNKEDYCFSFHIRNFHFKVKRRVEPYMRTRGRKKKQQQEKLFKQQQKNLFPFVPPPPHNAHVAGYGDAWKCIVYRLIQNNKDSPFLGYPLNTSCIFLYNLCRQIRTELSITMQ